MRYLPLYLYIFAMVTVPAFAADRVKPGYDSCRAGGGTHQFCERYLQTQGMTKEQRREAAAKSSIETTKKAGAIVK